MIPLHEAAEASSQFFCILNCQLFTQVITVAVILCKYSRWFHSVKPLLMIPWKIFWCAQRQWPSRIPAAEGKHQNICFSHMWIASAIVGMTGWLSCNQHEVAWCTSAIWASQLWNWFCKLQRYNRNILQCCSLGRFKDRHSFTVFCMFYISNT